MLRRLLVTLLFGLVVGGGALLTWHARNQALLVEDDPAAARTLLGRAGGFQAGELAARLDLIDQAETHAATAETRLRRAPLRQLGALPLGSTYGSMSSWTPWRRSLGAAVPL